MHALAYYSERLNLNEDVEYIFRKEITMFGDSATIDCPVRYIGKAVYLIVIILDNYMEIVLKGKVTQSGNRAKINCPIQYLNKTAYVIVMNRNN